MITVDEMKAWEGNVILDAGTGTGKTAIILEKFSLACYEPFKRILILSSRDALTKEIREKIEDSLIVNVEVESYQYIETCIKNGVTDSVSIFREKYDYICLDECQHFIEGISDYTDLSFQWIMQHSAQKIFMSATAKSLYRYLIEEDIVSLDNYYYVPKSYDYVEDIYFFKCKSDIEYIVDDLMTNTKDKIIVFVNSIDECLKLYYKYEGQATFYCSPSIKNVEAKSLLNKQPYKIKGESFETRLLIATSALDVGITLKSYEIKHVVASIFNHNQLAQCLGRKREITPHDKDLYIEGKSDTCTFYIRSFNKREMNLLDKSQELKELELFQFDNKQYIFKYGNDRKHINYNIYYNHDTHKWLLNELGYMNIKQHQNDLYEMREKVTKIGNKEYAGVGYKNYIIDKLKLPKEKVKEYEVIKQEQQELTLEQYLDSVVGKQLFKEEQNELKQVFASNGLSARTLGINTLNGNLKDRKFPYVILPKQTSKRTDGKVKAIRYWEVVNNIQT